MPRTYKGWTIVPPDHNSTWWDAERPSGRVASNGESIPEVIGAYTLKQLKRAIDRKLAQ